VLERALEAELTAHLGYDRHGRERPAGAGNYRNGAIAKTVQTGVGPVGLGRGTGRARSSRCWCPSGPGGSPAA
jgi:putative transposase